MDFPHLTNATDFPQNNVNVYKQYRNNFDYKTWIPNTKIKLVNVSFYNDYHDVVKFKNVAERDAYFDGITGESVTLKSSIYIQPDGIISLPFQYDKARNYNYICVEFPDNSADYSGANNRWYFFITNFIQSAPNTCNCSVELDIWTNFIYSANLSGMVVDRSHYPLTLISPEKLLENPLENSAYLLAQDVNYDTSNSRITADDMTNLDSGRKYLAIAMSISPSYLDTLAAKKAPETSDSNPVYSDNDESVSGFNWGAGGIDISEQNTIHSAVNSSGLYANSWYVYVLDYGDYLVDYLRDLYAYYPAIAVNFKAFYIVSSNMIIGGRRHNVNGRDMLEATAENGLIKNISLTPEMFDIPANYKNISKLYVSPYSVLEYTDNFNNSTVIKVEECGELSINQLININAPVLNHFVYLDGVGSNDSQTIVVNSLTNTNHNVSVESSDIIKALMQFDIPTFSITIAQKTLSRINNYITNVKQNRANTIVNYQNSAKSFNVSKSNATDSANTGNTNAVNSANNTLANTQAANTTSVDNTTDSNVLRTYLTNQSNSLATTNYNAAADFGDNSVINNITKLAADNNADTTVQQAAYAADLKSEAISNITNFGIQAGIGLGTGNLSGVGGAAMTSVNSAIALTSKEEINSAIIQNSLTKFLNAETAIKESNRLSKNLSLTMTNATNANRTQNTDKENSTASGIANRNANTSNANAQRSANVAIANAGRSKNTAINNADRSRNIATQNAKNSMLLARDNATAFYNQASIQFPSEIGSWSGSAALQGIGRKVVHLKVRTQSLSAIVQAGNYFTRFGIKSNLILDNPNLQPCKDFCFWKCSDLWITGRRISNDLIHEIKGIFLDGVTVWSDPDKIGNVDIYDNLTEIGA